MSLTIPSIRARAVAKLSLSASLLALGLLGGAVSAQAGDGDEEAGEAAERAIVVTGTRIEGVAPVGSSTVPVSREDMQNLGVSTANDALRKLPQVVNFGASNDQSGGSVIQNSSLNSFYAKSINLRGLGTASTLTLVNSHRVAPQGPSGQLFDADNIPGIAIERIEVVADGGSAIYGSDAIGGVVNFITRRPEDMVEAQFRVGLADSVEEYIGSVALGKTWGSGGAFVAYEYQKRTALEAADRPKLYNSDLSPYGGAPAGFFASPGNVIIDGVPYGIPSGQDGSALTLGGLLPTTNRQNAWLGADGVPSGERHSLVGNLEQELGDAVTFKVDAMYSRREYSINATGSTATLMVPDTNPFSPCYAGVADDSPTLDCPADGTLSVPYNFLYDLGPANDSGYERLWAVSAGFDIEVGERWNANITGIYSEDKGRRMTANEINPKGLSRALGHTVGGTDKPADVDYFNPFCDASQYSCNSEETLNLFRAFTDLGSSYEFYGGTANIGGPVFSIGGGDIRVAVGGEYHHDNLFGTGQISNTRTNTVDEVRGSPTSGSREVVSAYGEVFVPLFGPDNAVPGIERLELDVAVRYDHYSDVGSTTNPKIGVNYEPVAGLQFRGSYGTSFRAPTLVDVNPYATAGFLVRDRTGSAVGLEPAGDNFHPVYWVGGNPDLKPEEATTWSFGFDIGPELIPNFRAAVTYYNITYTNKVDAVGYNAPIYAALNSGAYDSFVTFNPNYYPDSATLTEAEFVDYWNMVTADPNLPVLGVINDPAVDVIALIDGRRNNGGVVETDGIDFMVEYQIPTDAATFRIGASGNYTFNYKTAPVPELPLVNEVNHFGYPAQFTGKIELGMDMGNFSATSFINYVNSREITRDFLPASIPDQYLDIDSYTTVDLTLSYNFDGAGAGFTDGMGFSLSAQNLFDAQPPLMVNSGGTPIRFDPSYASPVGRFVSFQISKKFY